MNDLNTKKKLVRRIVTRLEEESGIKYQLDLSDLKSKSAVDRTLKSLEDQLKRAIENDEAKGLSKALSDNLNSKNFNRGDKIRMNHGASEEYKWTKEGSEGEVIRSSGSSGYLVKFSLQTGTKRTDIENEWEVSSQYMEHQTLSYIAKKNGHIEKFAHQLVMKCVGEVMENIAKDDFTDRFIADLLEDKFLIKLDGNYGINLNRSFELRGGNLAKAYANPKLYTSPDMFSPPAERKIHVLRLELTQGCDHNA